MSENTVEAPPGAVDLDAEHKASLAVNVRDLLPEQLGAVCPGCNAKWDVAVRSDIKKLNPLVWNRIEGFSEHLEQQQREQAKKHAEECGRLSATIEELKATIGKREGDIAKHEAAKLQAARETARLEQGIRELKNKNERLSGEMDAKIESGRDELVKKLMPVTDAIDDALKNAEKQKKPDRNYIEGVRMLLRNVDSILKSAGYEPQQVVGEEFDANKHESVGAVETDEHPEGTIVEEVRRGYVNANSGIVVRHAKVNFAIPPAESDAEPAAEPAADDAADAPSNTADEQTEQDAADDDHPSEAEDVAEEAADDDGTKDDADNAEPDTDDEEPPAKETP